MAWSLPLLVGVWELPLVASPSVQLWIPHRTTGAPVVEGTFEQIVEEGQFAGAPSSTLPEPATAHRRGGRIHCLPVPGTGLLWALQPRYGASRLRGLTLDRVQRPLGRGVGPDDLDEPPRRRLAKPVVRDRASLRIAAPGQEALAKHWLSYGDDCFGLAARRKASSFLTPDAIEEGSPASTFS